MKIVGLITEYNPFHNGHHYHIEQALKLTGADAAVVVMSGDFVQRGSPAFMPKHLRAEAALRAGAAAVFELPVCYSTGSAELFAFGAVSLLQNLGCVDALCFGAESVDLDCFMKIAHTLLEEPSEYKNYLQLYLKEGDSFPIARQKAIYAFTGNPKLAAYLELPNNILAIEYLKALIRLDSKIQPYVLQREGSNYHDQQIHSNFASASAIRHICSEISSPDPASLHEVMPDSACKIFFDSWNIRFPIAANDFSLLLKYQLLSLSKKQLSSFADVTEDLANRIYKHRNQFLSFDQFCDLIKTKQLTYTRVSRGLLHILLGIRQSDLSNYHSHGHHGYARLLGFRTDKTELLTKIKKTGAIPVISKLSATTQLSKPFDTMLQSDIFCSDLYESVVTARYQTPFLNEYQKPIVRI